MSATVTTGQQKPKAESSTTIPAIKPHLDEPRVTLFRVFNQTRNTEIGDQIGVAGDGATRRKGLLGRTNLSIGEGLWIVPCEAVHTFGMKFNIDLVYLNRRDRVVKVRPDVPPRRLSASLTAHSILELPSGTIQRTQTQPGDTLEFKRF